MPRAGVALFRTGLTLETGVTGALNLARRTQQAGRGLFMAADASSLSEVRFLTVAEVATIMRVSKMTVYRLVHSGELEAIGPAGTEVTCGVGVCPAAARRACACACP